MEKPPTREEVMFDWFLGEAKDIAASLKETAQQVVGARNDLGTAKSELTQTSDRITRELVEAHRDLARVIQQASADQSKAASSVQSTVRAALSKSQSQTIAIAVGCSVGGGFLGALVASLTVPLLMH